MLIPPSPAVSKKYVFYSLVKLWGDNKIRVGMVDRQTGATLQPPFDMETKIALPILGCEEVEEELPPNTLTKEQFIDQLRQFHEMIKQINETQNNQSF